ARGGHGGPPLQLCLEENSEFALEDAGKIGLRGRLPKRGVVDVRIDSSETDLVEDVEAIDSENYLNILPDRKISRDTHISVSEGRIPQAVCSKHRRVAVSKWSGIDECVLVDERSRIRNCGFYVAIAPLTVDAR